MIDQEHADAALPLAVATGTARYYVERRSDFLHRCPDDAPPSYYADYGNKCLHQFLETQPTLSPRGQKWVDETLELLQEMMEAKRHADPSGFVELEQDDDAFRSFAFGTHSRAYQQAGVMELGMRDLWKIIRTPDVSDLLSDDGVKEILQLVLGRDGGDEHGLTFDPSAAEPGVLTAASRVTRRLRSRAAVIVQR